MSQQFSNTARRFRHAASFPSSPTIGDVIVDSSGHVLKVCLMAGVWSTMATVSATAPKVYRAVINQSGTAAPVAAILENSLGGVPVFSRSGGGV